MRTRTRPWLLLAAASVAALSSVGVGLLTTLAISRADGLLIALALVTVILLIVVVAGLLAGARSVRARERGRSARISALESDVTAGRTALEQANERLERVESLSFAVSALQDGADRTSGDVRQLEERLHASLKKHDEAVEVLEAEVARLQRRVRALETGKELAAASARIKKLEVRLAESPSSATMNRAGEVVDAVVALAERQGLSLTEIVTRPLAEYRVAAAAHGSEALEAIPFMDAFPEVVEQLTNAEARSLLRALRRAGYMSRAVPLISEIAARMSKPADVEMARVMASELALYSGALELDHTLPSMTGPRRQDVVMHVVGKALPTTQSGYTLRTHYTVEAQRRAGINAIVVTHSGSGPESGPETQRYHHDHVPYIALGGPERGRVPWDKWLSANVEALAGVVREERPAVLHVHSDFINALIALPVARAYGIPLVNETRGFWEESWLSRTARAEGWDDLGEIERRWGLPDMYRLRVEREAHARSESDAVVTLARVMERHIRQVGERLGLSVPPVSIASNAVDVASFAASTPDAALRASVGIGADSIVVGYVSSIVEYEGIDTLVRGVHTLREAMEAHADQDRQTPLAHAAAQLGKRDVQLLVVGDGPELDSLRELAASLGADRVHFTGRVPHERVHDYYALIDLFVVPRKSAAVTELVTPLKPFEAMAAKLPCLFSDVRALAEIAEDSGAAGLFRAGDPHDLALRLAQLLGDPQRLRTMGEQGAEWVRRERTWDRNAATYLELYRSLGMRLPDHETVTT